MAANEGNSITSGDEPEFDNDNQNKLQVRDTQVVEHGQAGVETKPKQITADEGDPNDQIADELGCLNISPDADEIAPHSSRPAEQSAENISHGIVIRPVEVPQNRDLRTSVVLVAGSGREIRPRLGIYQIEGRFLRPAKINKWVMVFLFDTQAVDDIAKGVYTFEDIKNFADRYVLVARSKGIQIAPLASIQCVPAQATPEYNVETMAAEDLRGALRDVYMKLNDHLVDHAIMILPENCPAWVHGHLQYLEACRWHVARDLTTNKLMKASRIRLRTLVDLGIKSLSAGKHSFIPQILLKYNSKLGGASVALKRTFETHEMKFLNDGHLIIAVDLCKHSNEPTRAPLISAAVGMWDLSNAQISFYTETRMQATSAKGAGELRAVKDLRQMTRRILAAFKERKNDRLPSRIMIFRVGPYQRTDDEVALQEITSIKEAIKDERPANDDDDDKQSSAEPILTYLKVPKKEKISKWKGSARATAENTREAAGPHDRSQGERAVQTGSLVSSILSNQVPQQASEPAEEPRPKPQGPSERPRSHVYKLYDEAKLSNTAIQSMIFALSYLSPRVAARTRPTPIDLADLAGERTHNLILAWMDDNKISPDDDQEKVMAKVNEFLANNLGDRDYKSHLYYA